LQPQCSNVKAAAEAPAVCARSAQPFIKLLHCVFEQAVVVQPPSGLMEEQQQQQQQHYVSECAAICVRMQCREQ
jgi:hypothetical protein